MAKKSSKPPVKEDENELLTQEQVFDVLKFAENFYRGVYTPELIASRMKDITMSPQVATADKISTALSDPKNNEEKLVGYSQWMELNSMLYKRVLLYFSGLMAFNLTYVCTNAKAEDYNKPSYKKDLQTVSEFFDRFDIKQEFGTAIKQMMRQEVFFSVFRDEGEKYILQELPREYCKITGRWDYGLLFDFDMYWFLQPAVSIDMYPNVFKRLYNKVFKGKQIAELYKPSMAVDRRSSTYIYWAQTRPTDGFFALKFNPEIATIVPFLSPFMADTVLQPVIRELQKNSYIAEASKLIFGQVEFLKDAQAKVKDALSITPEVLGKFLALIQAGLPDAIKVGAAPLAGTTGIEFSGSDSIYDSYQKTTASTAGINSRLIYSYDRQNVLETKLSMDVDINVVRPVYKYFANILEYLVNQRTKKFKFKFTLQGFNLATDREERLNLAQKLADNGIVLEQLFSSAMDMSPFDFRRHLEETKANNFVESLTPLLKSNQMGGATSGAGRPPKPDSELTDSGSEGKESGSNLEQTEN